MRAIRWITVALWAALAAPAYPAQAPSGAKEAAQRRAEVERAALVVQRLEQAIEDVQARQRKLRAGTQGVEESPARVGARAQVEAARAELERARRAVEDRMRADPRYLAVLADVQAAAARLKAAREDPASRATASVLAGLSERLLAAETRANQLLQRAYASDRQVASLQGKLRQQMELAARLADGEELRADQKDAPRREQLKKSAQELNSLRLKLQDAQRKLQAARAAGLR